MESFSQIIDPETDQVIDTSTSHGKLIIKNYLNAIKYGPETDKIVSTKMFYKEKKSSKSNLKQKIEKEKISEDKVQSNNNKESNNKSLSKQTGGNLGTSRGLCPRCKKDVFSTQERVKSNGKYYHEQCYQCS
tara:strand:+ start:1214 stop:1609 length:396 start_codon:yes stop_codon:yes gene_type:complete